MDCVFDKCKNKEHCKKKGYVCPAMCNIPADFNPMTHKIVEIKIRARTKEEVFA